MGGWKTNGLKMGSWEEDGGIDGTKMNAYRNGQSIDRQWLGVQKKDQ